VVFWDFDGVIKESLDIKADGFERLFLPYGRSVAARVREHHEANGGVSRYEKIALYLQWAGESPTAERVEEVAARFAALVCDAVVEAAWVPGVDAYLAANHERQDFVLVTGTPQAEIERILNALRISHWFREVHGSPKRKEDAVRDVLTRWKCAAANCVAVGDSATDLHAAVNNGIRFALRMTPHNELLRTKFSGITFVNLV
jgi:phosphoglycolate phosphatase-like HAD superfamily hydrolase